MAMTRGRFQGREPNQGGRVRPALASLSDQRADELLKKFGGRGGMPLGERVAATDAGRTRSQGRALDATAFS
jgi:hypothetical protein